MKKALIPIAGQTACRIMQSFKRLEIPTIAIYSDRDRWSTHVMLADETFRIGQTSTSTSFIPSIVRAAICTGAKIIHPGYGTLSRSVQLAELCERGRIQFLGPPSCALHTMNDTWILMDKIRTAGLPILPEDYGKKRFGHIEVPILGDKEGNIIYLGEFPSKMGEAAVTAAKALSYHGAGTVEFVFDEDSEEYYFTGIDTRFEVCHSIDNEFVAEDIVEWQLLVAEGQTLPIRQCDVPFLGPFIATYPPRTGLFIVPDCWKPTRYGGLKFNTDATWSDLLKVWFTSTIGRDHDGIIRLAAVMIKNKCAGQNVSFEGEVYGMKMGAVRAKELNLSEYCEIFFETDSAEVAKCLMMSTHGRDAVRGVPLPYSDDVVVGVKLPILDLPGSKHRFEPDIWSARVELEDFSRMRQVYVANIARTMNASADTFVTDVKALCESNVRFKSQISTDGFLLFESSSSLQSVIQDSFAKVF